MASLCFGNSDIALRWLPIISLILYLHSTPTAALTTFYCDSLSASSSCTEKSVLSCEANQDCHIHCIGDSSCERMTFHCPSNGDCIIHCGATANDTQSCFQTLFTTQANTNLLNITAIGTNSMAYSTVFCPDNNNNDNACSITSLDGHSQLSHLSIYATNSLQHVHLYCHDNDCYAPNENPTIFCSDFHSDSSCQLQLTTDTQHEWQCTAATADSVCNTYESDNPFVWSTTKVFFNLTQTVVNEHDIIVNESSPIPPVLKAERASPHDLQSYMQAIIIGCICAAAFCLVVIAICIILIYLNQTNSEALANIVDVDVDVDADLVNIVDVETAGNDTDTDKRPSRVFIYDASGRYIDPDRRVTNLPKPKPRKKRRISHRRGKLSRDQLAKIAAKAQQTEQRAQRHRDRHRQRQQPAHSQHDRRHSSQTAETENIEISIVLPGGAPSLANNLSNDTVDGYRHERGNSHKRLSELQVLKEENGCVKQKPLKARLPSHFSNALHVQISDLAETDDDCSDSQHEGVPIERVPASAQQ